MIKETDFLGIKNPLSYKCESSGLTAEDLINYYMKLSFCRKIEKNLTMEMGHNEYMENDIIYKILLNGSSFDKVHIAACEGCMTFYIMFSKFFNAARKNSYEFSELIKKPYGLASWLTVTKEMQENGFDTFDQYLDHRYVSSFISYGKHISRFRKSA